MHHRLDTSDKQGTLFAAVRVEGGILQRWEREFCFCKKAPIQSSFVDQKHETCRHEDTICWNCAHSMHLKENKSSMSNPRVSPIKRHDLVMIGTHKTSHETSAPCLPGISRLNTMGMTSFRFCLCFQKTSRRFGWTKKMKGGWNEEISWRNAPTDGLEKRYGQLWLSIRFL